MAQRCGFYLRWSQYAVLLNNTLSALLLSTLNGTEVRVQSMVVSICCIVEHHTVCIASVDIQWHRGEGSIHGGLNMLYCWTNHFLNCFSWLSYIMRTRIFRFYCFQIKKKKRKKIWIRKKLFNGCASYRASSARQLYTISL